ncbi:MAG: hypothetical protein J7L53_00860 [Deltaproteobacteria bacterium]|nr:hypothetical protein [Deltaproteobacteria bacterium]
MGKDYTKEDLIQDLTKWRSINEQELDALRQGDLPKLEALIDESVPIQVALDQALSEIDLAYINKDAIVIMKEIQDIQETLIKEVQNGCTLLRKSIQKIRQNRTSLNGYRQERVVSPRFLNKRT